MIQERLEQEAQAAGIPIVDGGEAGDLTQDIVDEIVQLLDAGNAPSSST